MKIASNKDYDLILECRSIDRGNKTKEETINKTGNNNIKVLEIDISSLESVRNFVEKFKKLNINIYRLVNSGRISGINNGSLG